MKFLSKWLKPYIEEAVVTRLVNYEQKLILRFEETERRVKKNHEVIKYLMKFNGPVIHDERFQIDDSLATAALKDMHGSSDIMKYLRQLKQEYQKAIVHYSKPEMAHTIDALKVTHYHAINEWIDTLLDDIVKAGGGEEKPIEPEEDYNRP